MVKTGAAELEDIQQELKTTHKWLDKKHDFSGQPKDSAYQAWGDMASLKLQALPELRAKALGVVNGVVWQTRSHVQGTRQVAGVVPRHLEVRTVFQVHLRVELRHLRTNHLRKGYLRKVAN